MVTYQWAQKETEGPRCRYCGAVIGPGESYYRLGGQAVCRDCLPLAAAVVLLPFRRVAGEEAWR